jgi:hypothetical protein
MRKYVLVGSLRRGAIDPPEPVSADTQSQLLKQDARLLMPHMLKMKPEFNGERWIVGENGIPIRIYPQQEWALIRMLGR